MRKITDEAWVQGRLYHHYHRHRKGHITLDTSLLEVLRERHWKHIHAKIAEEVAAITATVLTPPGDEHEYNHGAGTLHDAHKTVRCNSEPL